MAASLDALASRVKDMSVERVEEAAVRVVSETGHVQGLEEITGVFDKGEVALGTHVGYADTRNTKP